MTRKTSEVRQPGQDKSQELQRKLCLRAKRQTGKAGSRFTTWFSPAAGNATVGQHDKMGLAKRSMIGW